MRNAHTRKNHTSGARKISYKDNRYRVDFVDAVHFNNRGMKACNVVVLDPKHSTNRSEVTCRYCKKFLETKHVID